jgi:mannose-1-phosphate guanylyltransferase
MVVNVILSGGGSRLWPLSRKSKPKQYLPIFEGESLFAKTVRRNQKLTDALIVVGNVNNYELSVGELNGLFLSPKSHIIEACPRNTAAAIAFAAFAINKQDILLVTPSDHLIDSKQGAYSDAIHRALELAAEGNLVTFGLYPTYAETGYGYIENEGEEVLSFREKPNESQAQQYLGTGNYLWNSGMFCFQAGSFLEELKLLAPEVYFPALAAFESCEGSDLLDESLSLLIPSISVDYAVIEKSNKVKVVPSSFLWSDMGSFASIYDYLVANGHTVDPNGNLVLGTDRYVAFVGLQNSILVATEDAILVLNKEQSQGVKQVYDLLADDYK